MRLGFFRRSSIVTLSTFLLILSLGTASSTTPPGPLVDVEWLKANLEREAVVVIDTRSVKDGSNPYAEGHVPGAIHAPYPRGWRTTRDGIPGQLPPIKDLERHIGSLGITGSETIVLVPAASDATEFGGATRIYWTLKLVGIENVAILNGGYRAWSADETAAIEKVPRSPQPAAFTASLRPELLISSEEVRRRLSDNSTVLVDGRPYAQFTGKEKSPLAKLFGRLPGATHLDQSVFFDSETGRLLPKEAAAKLVPANITDPGVEIVSYCNTAHWASMNWFVLSEVLGYQNVTLFDDSMVGWTEDPSNPIESDRTRLDELKDWWKELTR